MLIDALGAVVVARSFVLKRPVDVFRELRSFGRWDFHITIGARDLLLSWLIQSNEARTGAALLAFGFLLQAFAQVLPLVAVSSGGYILVLMVICVFGGFFVLQSWFVRHAAKNAQSFYIDIESEAVGQDWLKAIPQRRQELTMIERAPHRWLKGTMEPPEDLDPTLTSNA